jgi:Mn-dependent DtxR family transcriptional regulator
MMSVAAGVLFLAVFLFAPRYGLASRLINQAVLGVKIAGDDILGFLYRLQELAPTDSRPARMAELKEALKGGAVVAVAVKSLLRREMLRRAGEGLVLTAAGLEAGRSLIRSHRLWEAYLCDRMGYCAEDVHLHAHRLEHFTDPDMQAQLDEAAGHPSRDAHDPIIP